MPRTVHTNPATPSFVADEASLSRNPGRSIDWANVAADGTYGVTGRRIIPAGKVMGELLSTDGRISPRVVTTNPATCILYTNAVENENSHAHAYGCLVGGVVYENLLPDAAGGPPKVLAAALKTELDAAGCHFNFQQYSDSRAS